MLSFQGKVSTTQESLQHVLRSSNFDRENLGSFFGV